MQENNKITVGRDPQHENMISQCSCTKCDSIGCFVKRQAEEPLCTCESCKSSTSCLFRNINLDDTKLSTKDIKDLAMEFAVENLAREIIKKQIIYELTTSNNEQTIKEQCKLTYKIPDSNDSKNIEPQNAATTSFKEVSSPKAQLSDGVLNRQYKDSKKYKAISANNSKVRNNKSNAVAANNFIKQASSSHAKLKAQIADMQYKNLRKDKIDNLTESKSKYDKPNATFVSGTDATNLLKRPTSSIAKASAEVMNIHYKDSQKTLAKPLDISNIISIINKIKEAYKACSCKVCECIVGKSLDNELCKCKPCECSDCTSFNYKHARTNSERLFPTSGDKCSCAVCVKRSCQGISNTFLGGQTCDCTGVLKNNNLYGNDSFKQPCDCEPCQCIECRTRFISRQGLIVAPVIEDNQNRSVCDCAPCECGECIPAHYGLSSNLQNEMSTGVNRHPQCHCEMCANEACVPDGNQSCRCERQSRVMNKPFQQNTRDYDIRRTNVSYSNKRHKNNRDTIAMYATVMKSYPNQTDYLKNSYSDQCECLNCKDNNNTTITNEFSTASALKLLDAELNSYPKNEVIYDCKCCKYQENATHYSKIDNLDTNFGYSVCSGRNSLQRPMAETFHETKKTKNKFSARDICQCECADCKKLMSTDIVNKCTCSNSKTKNYVKLAYSDEFVYPVKRGEILTPAIFNRKIHDALINTCSNTAANDKITKQLGILKSSLKKSSAIKSCYKPTFRDNDKDSLYEKSGFQDEVKTRTDNPMFLSSYFSQSETVKHAESRYCDETKMPKYNELPDLSQNSLISHSEQRRSPPSRSSYRDYPNYFVHYSNKVESCLNDSMRTGNANNIDLVTMSLQSKIAKQNMCPDDKVPNCIKNQLMKPFSFEEPTLHYKSTHDTHAKGNKYSKQNDNKNLHSTRIAPSYSDSDIKPIKYAYLKTFFDNLGLNKDYMRIRNILRESRAFSSQLLQLLEKYDKANREFESVSKKFETPNYTFQNVITIEENLSGAFGVCDIPTKDFKTSSTNISVVVNKSIKKLNVSQFLNKCESSDAEKGEANRTSACIETNEGRDESGDDTSKIDNTHSKTLTESIDESNHKCDKTNHVAKPLQNKYKRNDTRDITQTINEIDYTSSLKEETTELDNITTQEENIPNKTYKKNIFEINTTEDLHKNTHKVVEVADLQENVNKSKTDLRVPESENDEKPTVEQSKDIIDWIRDPWPILKKNFCLNNKLSSRSETMTPIEKDVKAFQKMISKQPNDENATYLYKNKALIKLYSEVKKLVDLPTLQTFECIASVKKAMQCKHDIVLNSLSKASSSQTVHDVHRRHSPNQDKTALSPSISRNSCDAFKVNFLNVRQVSHHTLLVKWSVPHALNNVEGYELLVDGRAVKKILVPTSCMAVVTCLHSGKVLLTVRTVMNAPCPDHCPASTVIYQPRVK